MAAGGFLSISDLLRQSLGLEKKENGEGRMAMMRKVVAEWPQVYFCPSLIS